MFSTKHRALISVCCSLLWLLVVVTPGFTPVTVPGSVAFADPNIPRSYVEFIDGAYLGALGRSPNCFEEQAEYDLLANAAANGVLLQEAQRFVSTLFETQASYNAGDLTTYCQTSEYESRNPAFCNPNIGTGLADFLTHNYRAYLLREPDTDGFNWWMNNNNGRKHLLEAFRLSIEFEVLVSNLFAGSRPICTIECPECNPDPCEGPNQGGKFSKLCP